MAKKYILHKATDNSGRVAVDDRDNNMTATYYNSRLSNVTIKNTEVLYADGVNANCITLKDKNATISYDEGRVSVSVNGNAIDPNSAEGKKLISEATKARLQADNYTSEIAHSKALGKHNFTKDLATAETQKKFEARVTVKQSAKKAKQKVAQGVRGAQASSNDPNMDVALGRTPTYSKGKTAAAPKQDRVTADNIDQKVDEILDKASQMTEDEIIDRFEKEHGKGSWEAVKKAEEARIKAERMSKQRRGGR